MGACHTPLLPNKAILGAYLGRPETRKSNAGASALVS
jgi:hypothetical protein